ncbi:hypothetical protein Q428_05960 [Fervidicella metallireducens AeB]|uniref:DUF2920 family protein n=1 Tax=Fervidicella metallireducens AeB TaxID=1403537 RepID=A0A017RVL5_9CLOT|nr:DUF2920 family protein [Fervidicella metallireducens]EYE88823.1 hypothetical protein Q428_05960 [Fervidicella metallireducens AeB]
MQQADKIIIPNLDQEQINRIFTKQETEKIYKNGKLDFDEFLRNAMNYNININVKADLSGETLFDFNDMGIMQALDNIVATLRVMNIIYENNCEFNSKKVIIYGQSHGAYLAYLCNAFAPTLFSLIIDNSAWIYPVYLKANRFLFQVINNFTLSIEFEYLAKK